MPVMKSVRAVDALLGMVTSELKDVLVWGNGGELKEEECARNILVGRCRAEDYGDRAEDI